MTRKKTEFISLRVDDRLKERIEAAARLRGYSRTDYIRVALHAQLRKDEQLQAAAAEADRPTRTVYKRK